MLVLGFDLETTGLEIGVDEIIEFGAVLYDTKRKVPLEMLSTLVRTKREITEEITDITGILPEEVEKYGAEFEDVYEHFLHLVEKADALVAHNGKEFDLPFLKAQVGAYESLEPLPSIPLIDTMLHILYPKKFKSKNQVYLAAEHGFVNPFPHRAVFDAMTMLRILSNYDPIECLKIAVEPTRLCIANCKKPWLDSGLSTNEAKEYGFRWNPQDQVWAAELRESQIKEIQENAKNFSIKLSD